MMLQKKQLTMGTLLFKKLCMQLEELSESKVTDKNVGGDYCEKDGSCTRGSDACKTLVTKKIQTFTFYNIESTEDKRLETDPNLEKF